MNQRQKLIKPFVSEPVVSDTSSPVFCICKCVCITVVIDIIMIMAIHQLQVTILILNPFTVILYQVFLSKTNSFCWSTYIHKRPNIGNALRGFFTGVQSEKDGSNKTRKLSHMSLGVISTKQFPRTGIASNILI